MCAAFGEVVCEPSDFRFLAAADLLPGTESGDREHRCPESDHKRHSCFHFNVPRSNQALPDYRSADVGQEKATDPECAGRISGLKCTGLDSEILPWTQMLLFCSGGLTQVNLA